MTRRLSLLLILLGAVTLAACGGEGAVPAAEAATAELPPLPADVAGVEAVTRPVTMPAAIAEADPLVDGVFAANGEFVSPSRSDVAPKIPGRVARVYVDDGARVTRGQPLFALETDYMRLDLQRAEAELAQADAAAAEAARDFERKQELRLKESIPQATFDRSRAAFEQARAAQAAARAGVGTARQRLADAVVPSPLTGVVAERRVDVGEFLADGGVGFVVLQTAPLKLRFQVPERYLARIRTGQTVSATVDPYPGEVFTGTIRTVGGVIDPQTRTMFAEAEFANADGRLRPGLFARVEAKLQ